jgi:hypothetical protein
MSQKIRIQFRVPAELHDWLHERSGLSMHGNSTDRQAEEDLGLLKMIIDEELRGVRLTLEQASCVADVLNGPVLEPAVGSASLGMVYAACCDAFMYARMGPEPGRSSYGRKHCPRPELWQEWEDFLLGYLLSLRPAADYALRYAIALWWERGLEMTPAGFVKAGLQVMPPLAEGG